VRRSSACLIWHVIEIAAARLRTSLTNLPHAAYLPEDPDKTKLAI